MSFDLFFFFFSVLSFIFLETSSYQSDILCPEKHVYLWPGICTEKKKMSMVSFGRIFFVKFLKVKKKHAVYM